MVDHFQITLTGAAQQLSAGLTEAQAAQPYEQLLLQADDGNSNPVYVGGDSTVTAAAHGLRIPLPPANVPEIPVELSGAKIFLRDLWAIGTADELLNILAVRRD